MKVVSRHRNRKTRPAKASSKQEKDMKIRVDIRECEGTFYATSDDLPGFFLCNRDVTQLSADIHPALKQLIAIKAAHQKKPAKAKSSNLIEQREFAVA